MTRAAIHKWLDEVLDGWGFDDDVTLSWGDLTFVIHYADGKVVLREKQRETQK